MTGENSTHAYYRHEPIDLLTEFTVCESLATAASPSMAALADPAPYGEILGRALIERGALQSGSRLCEAGGGYGSLMRGLLDSCGPLVQSVTMIDLSRHLLGMQRRRLEGTSVPVHYVNGDIMSLLPAVGGIDLLILNEVIGDLDTLTELDPRSLPPAVSSLVDRYGFAVPPEGPFSFNRGAVLLAEEICRRGIPAFIAEHASDYLVPADMPYLARGLGEDCYPREIRLKGHSEYTIRFSHLVDVATYWNRKVATGPLLDFVGVRKDAAMRFIFCAGACATDEQEIILEFLDHAREYRWLIIQ